MLRAAIVRGQFYPQSVEELKKMIKEFTPEATSRCAAKGIILPHAGYIYSGKVAVTTVSKILPKRKVIILGPNHTGYGSNFALMPKGEWETPSRNISIDEDLATRILEKGNYIEEDYLAHRNEHSIEVELPILDYFFQEFKFVPICCQISSINAYRKVADQIFAAIKSMKEEILFVASTDFTHYEPDDLARRKDRAALENIIDLDAENLVKTVSKEGISMCGVAPVAVLIYCIKNLGAKKASVALYQTSADASGDYSSVVGYGGVIIN